MNRRDVLKLLSALPFVARLGAQTRATGQHRIVFGLEHGFLIGPDGTLKVWQHGLRTEEGSVDWLGLGHNDPVARWALLPVPGLSNVVSAAAGNGCSFAVLANGQVMAWGSNAGGMLGTTPLALFEKTASWGSSSNKPIPVVTKFDAVAIDTKKDHVVALARDGTVYTWGKADAGQLGIGAMPDITFLTNQSAAETYLPFPARVPDLTEVVAISAGYSHTLALLKDGTVRAWGDNSMGQLGDGTTETRTRPVPAQGVRNAIGVAAGADFSVALLANGTAMTWGNASNNKLARNSTDDSSPEPTPAPAIGATNLRSIVASNTHVIALTNAGTVMTWGNDTYGQLGAGDAAASKLPTIVKGLSDVRFVTGMASTSIAIQGNGRILTWGGVRPWTRPGGGRPDVSRSPILLWLDGLDQPPW